MTQSSIPSQIDLGIEQTERLNNPPPLEVSSGRKNVSLLARKIRIGAVAATVGLTGAIASNSTPSADAAPIAERVNGGDELSIFAGDLEDPDDIELIQLTAASPDGGGYFSTSATSEFSETASLNFKDGKNTANLTFQATDPGGNFRLQVDGSFGVNTHVIADSVGRIRAGAPVEVFDRPSRVLDTGQTGDLVRSGGTIDFSVGEERAGQTAIVTLGVGGNETSGFHTLFPCDEGRQGTSSLNASPGGADSITTISKVDASGNLCLYSDVDGNRAVVDVAGYIDGRVNAMNRITDTREEGGRLRSNSPSRIKIGEPNRVHTLNVAVARTSDAGWLACYSGEHNGTSNINFDGISPKAGLVIVRSDEAGEIGCLSSVDTDVVIDGTPIEELDDYVEEGSGRLLDTRNLQPDGEIPPDEPQPDGQFRRIDATGAPEIDAADTSGECNYVPGPFPISGMTFTFRNLIEDSNTTDNIYDGTRIDVYAHRDGDPVPIALWTQYADGEGVARVTANEIGTLWPSWSGGIEVNRADPGPLGNQIYSSTSYLQTTRPILCS